MRVQTYEGATLGHDRLLSYPALVPPRGSLTRDGTIASRSFHTVSSPVLGGQWRGRELRGTVASERAVSFFTIEPEASGSPAAGAPVGAVACVFDSWLGDDLVRAHPAVLATTPVKGALLGLHQPTGFEIVRARIRSSGFFRKHSPGKRLPAFWAIQVRGQAGRDDMGLTAAGTLVVSRRVLDLLLDFRICLLYTSPSPRD